AYKPEIPESAYRLLADAFDVRGSLHPVDQRLEPTRRAGAVGAAVHGLALRLDDVRAAERALLRHLEGLRALDVRKNRADDLRDHVTGTLDDHVVALADVLAVDVFLVVQRRLRHRHAADLDGLELRPGIERPCSPDSDVNLVQLRLSGHRRPLEGARPPGTIVQCTEPALLVEGVDLDHDPVDLVVELDAALLPFPAGCGNGLDRVVMLRVGVRPEAVLAQPLQCLPVTGRGKALALTEPVDPDRERPRSCDRRVLLAQRSGRSVARVRSRLLALRDQPLVELVEAAEREVHLASNLE